MSAREQLIELMRYAYLDAHADHLLDDQVEPLLDALLSDEGAELIIDLLVEKDVWLPQVDPNDPVAMVEYLKERGVLVDANWLLEHPDPTDPVFTISLPGGES